MSKHGSSMITFMKNLDREDITVLMIEDSKGFKFGSFCLETWVHSKQYYGSPDTFVYSFGTQDDCKIFKSTGRNYMFQYFDRSCLMVGGDTGANRAALYLGDDFYRGSSAKSFCFNNEILSSQTEFLCADLEVWGLY